MRSQGAHRPMEAAMQRIQLAEHAPVAIFALWGPEHVVMLANRLACALWGRLLPEQVRTQQQQKLRGGGKRSAQSAMTVKAEITEISYTSFRVELRADASQQVWVELRMPNGWVDRRPVQVLGLPTVILPTVVFDRLEPGASYRVTVESVEGTQQLWATTVRERADARA